MRVKLLLLIVILLILNGCSSRNSSDSSYSKPLPPPEPSVSEPSKDYAGESASEELSGMVSPAPSARDDRMTISSSADGPFTPRPTVPSQSGLKAGFADDNLQFNQYLEFLEKYKNVPQIDFPVQERIIIRVSDKNGDGLPDASVEVRFDGNILAKARTYADGRTLFFPSEYPEAETYDVSVSYGKETKVFKMNRHGERLQEFSLPVTRAAHPKIPVDILFILDTTGSMGEEIQRLKSTLLIIHENLNAMSIPLDIRFGMVMYKDRGDDYITKTIKFTNNVESFQKSISTIRAYGGGDTPEDMQTALQVSVTKMGWREEGVRLAYLITDAPAHLDYGQTFTLLSSSQRAREKGIKLFSVGTGGLTIDGEINLRQIAQYTMGKYIFLTYGERGESEGGAPGSVSHHTGSNFTADKLESIIIRFSKEEIGNFALMSLEEEESYFKAVKNEEDSLKILSELFGSMISQLASYSTVSIPRDTPVAVLPLTSDDALAADAEYFTEQLYHASAGYKGWKSVERKDLQKILDEIKFNLSGLVDEADMIKLESLTGAKMLVTGTVYEKDGNYEIYLKLLRTETSEVLSVTRAKAERSLGLSR